MTVSSKTDNYYNSYEQGKRGDTLARAAKRTIDIVGSALLIVFLLPFLVLVSLAILIADGWPIFYRHRRVGRAGIDFHCLKFRTMVNDAPERLAKILSSDPAALQEWTLTQKLRDDPRVLKIGSFLRRSSIDELPQLFNVLWGHMSLIGPRPIVRAEMARYDRYIDHYLSMRPGITGLWQVSGRSDTSYDQRVRFDTDYALNWSLRLDVRIAFRTVIVVLMRRGAT